MPPTVRLYCEAVKRSAPPIIACSWSESRRRIGSATIVSSAARDRVPSSEASQPPPRRLRSGETIGVVGAPSRSQPYSTAASAQSGQTSTKSLPPFGENRIAFSPIRSVRSQIAHERSTVTRVTRVIPRRVPRSSGGDGFLLLLGVLDQLLRDVRRHFLVAQELHVIFATAARERGEGLVVGQHLGHRHLGLDRRHAALGLHAVQPAAARVEVA